MHLELEQQLWKQGYHAVVGLDEAGRGPWAGPLVVGAVVFPKTVTNKKLRGIQDSKKLNVSQLRKHFQTITKLAAFSTGLVEHHEIDFWGLGKAVQLGIVRALAGLSQSVDYLLLDARMWKTRQIPVIDSDYKALMQQFYHLPFQSFIRGEDVSISIAAASIVAKVTRDQIMQEYAKQYPQYGFENHKGYGTAVHQEKLAQHGSCPIHRLSFKPVQKWG